MYKSAMYSFGDIVLVPFPFTDLTSSKLRPALIVSKDGGHRDDVIVCFITSNLDQARDGTSLFLEKGTQTGLKVRSAVKLHRIATLKKSIIIGKLGSVEKQVLQNHKKQFMAVFGW